MNLTDNTILITGGGSGIGRGLAESLHRSGNKVVIAGLRREALRAVADANPGMTYLQLDLADPTSIARLATELTDGHPRMNVLVNNAGIMHTERLPAGDTGAVEATVATNLLGPIRLTAALLPTLLTQPHAAVINVTSALAFVPKADAPTYSATKAAMHSYTQSLRRRLRGTPVQVIEIIPPRVETEMLYDQPGNTDAMSLDSFVAETISQLETQPDATEVVVDAAKHVRFAACGGDYEHIFEAVNP
jgi:uncharacterized oxidoreductase